jgi:hypothetical protein
VEGEAPDLTLWSGAWWDRVGDVLRARGLDVRADVNLGWELQIPGSALFDPESVFVAGENYGNSLLLRDDSVELVSEDPEYAANVIHMEYLRWTHKRR